MDLNKRYDKQQDGCCHKTVVTRCVDCSYVEDWSRLKTPKELLQTQSIKIFNTDKVYQEAYEKGYTDGYTAANRD